MFLLKGKTFSKHSPIVEYVDVTLGKDTLIDCCPAQKTPVNYHP